MKERGSGETKTDRWEETSLSLNPEAVFPSRRGLLCNLSLATAVVAVAGMFAEEPLPARAKAATPVSARALREDYAVPVHFAQLATDRKTIDDYQRRHQRVEPGLNPSPDGFLAVRQRQGRFVRLVLSEPAENIMKYRAALPQKFAPLRGFRAPILERAQERSPALLPTQGLSQAERSAADCVARRLARDGLLTTLTQVIQILGPAAVRTNPAAAVETLTAIGFPTDLLEYFSVDETAVANRGATGVVSHLARRLGDGIELESLETELAAMPFRLVRASPAFQVATESGEHEPGLLRMQAGGGYRDGVVPGDTIDVINQMARALPEANSLISIPIKELESFRWMVTNSWRLRRAGQVTLVGEPLPVASWAQDNGKAGFIAGIQPGQWMPATLAPRYACIDEGQSTFLAGESFLMDGLKAAGHQVVHSALLFQGGNLMAVRNPKSGERILFIGEGEVYRNQALGLARARILEAFRVEFGVDRCVALPAVSYHLDFDVSFRTQEGESWAFVNDALAAARIILGAGIGALERHGALDAKSAAAARAELAGNHDLDLVLRLANAARTLLQGRQDLPASLSKFFATGKMDSAAGNLQSFLLALDLLESSSADKGHAGRDRDRDEYLLALRRLEAAPPRTGGGIKADGMDDRRHPQHARVEPRHQLPQRHPASQRLRDAGLRRLLRLSRPRGASRLPQSSRSGLQNHVHPKCRVPAQPGGRALYCGSVSPALTETVTCPNP